MPTFEQTDYLAIGPMCWGRSGKNAKDAVEHCSINRPFRWCDVKKDAKVFISLYRLSDSIDQVQVHDGGFTWRPLEGHMLEQCKAVLVAKIPWNEDEDFSEILEQYEPVAITEDA